MQLFFLVLLLGFASSELQQNNLPLPLLTKFYRSVNTDEATIGKSFGEQKAQASATPGAVSVNAKDQKCQCVPYYLCEDYTDSRFLDLGEENKCPTIVDVCCIKYATSPDL